MLNPASSLYALLDAPIRDGQLLWIGLRPGRREAVASVTTAALIAGLGLVGDRYAKPGGSRQVTLIAAEALAAIASHLGLAVVAPDLLRRNLVVGGINLHALKGRCLWAAHSGLATLCGVFSGAGADGAPETSWSTKAAGRSRRPALVRPL